MATNNENNDKHLEPLRRRIDELDRQIIELLNQRAEVVVQVGKAKAIGGAPIYAPDREQAVLRRIAELNRGPLPQKTLQAIYRELMSGSFALEKPLRIGYLGPEGSFSHLASERKFGSSVEYRALTDIRAVFEEVARGHCDLGVVPIENTTGGGVIDTMDSFIDADVHICAEVLVEIHHNLLAKCAPDEIKLIASKPEVFAQCRNWLSATFKDTRTVPVASTAKAAQMAEELQRARPIEPSMVSTDHVSIGTRVTVEDTRTGERTTYTILGPWDADVERGIIAYVAPLARALLRKRVGEEATLTHQGATTTYRIVSIENALAETTSGS